MLHGDVLSDEKIRRLVDLLLAASVLRDRESRWVCAWGDLTGPHQGNEPGWEPVGAGSGEHADDILWRRRAG